MLYYFAGIKRHVVFCGKFGWNSKIESDRQKRLRQMFVAEEINIALVYVFSLLVIPHIVLISYSAHRFNIDRMT